MPDELAEMRDRYLTATANAVAAEDSWDAAVAEAEAATERADVLREATQTAANEESRARAAYVAALRSHGYVDTASGPVPAPSADDPRYEITLTCGDTYSSNVRPGLGNTRRCIHCETRQRVATVRDCATDPAGAL